MEFINEFVVPAPIDQAWTLLNDVPTIAPCLPGAQVRALDAGTYEGTVTVKVGPIKVGYQGIASFTELDPERRVMVLDARGSETSGKGSAAATVRVTLTEKASDMTVVEVLTDLQVTGRIAQFGRTVMADVGSRIIGQFAANLEQLIASGGHGQATRSSNGSAATPRDAAASVTADPATSSQGGGELDMLSLALPLLKRAAPAAGALVIGLLAGRLLGRRRPQPAVTADLAAIYPLLLDLARPRGFDENRTRH